MRNIIILACTLTFVLIGACQQEQSLVDQVVPVDHLIPAEAPAFTVAPDKFATELDEILHILYDLYNVISEKFPRAFADGDIEAIAEFLDQRTRDEQEVIQQFGALYTEYEDTWGITRTLSTLRETSLDFWDSLSGTLDMRTGTPCFDQFQEDMWEASLELAACLVIPEGVISIICTAKYVYETYTAFDHYYECMSQY